MGYLGYAFVPLTTDQVEARRISLDSHARLAQFSQVAVLAFVSAVLFFGRLFPATRLGPSKQHARLTWPVAFARRSQWRLQAELAHGYGTWTEWLFGISCAAWLAFLCVHDTSPGESARTRLELKLMLQITCTLPSDLAS
jgi:hypothetical protein